jgi:hypothetical protein
MTMWRTSVSVISISVGLLLMPVSGFAESQASRTADKGATASSESTLVAPVKAIRAWVEEIYEKYIDIPPSRKAQGQSSYGLGYEARAQRGAGAGPSGNAQGMGNGGGGNGGGGNGGGGNGGGGNGGGGNGR